VYPGREFLLVQSGTVALMLLLEATRGERANACVALPAYACPDIGAAALGAGFALRLYDVDPQTLQPDFSSLDAALKSGATHVLAVHLFGRLVDVPAVISAAEPYGAVVIEDAAQHAGGRMLGQRGGSLAAISVLSFGRGKGLNAGGGGALSWVHGALPSQPLQPPEASPAYKQLLVAGGTDVFSHPMLYPLPASIPALGLGETRFKAAEPAREISGVSAALLSAALKHEPAALRARQVVEEWYDRAFTGAPGLSLQKLANSESGALRYPVRVTAARAWPLSRFGVLRSYPRTLAEYAPIAAALQGPAEMKGATELARSLHTLPTHALLNERARKHIVRQLRHGD
jgi:dTDP-4-amino-4,6-dideoxygalactose transaminase